MLPHSVNVSANNMSFTTGDISYATSIETKSVDSGEMLSDVARTIFVLVNHVVISTLICLFGVVGNCLNIAVFLKQGLRKPMNVSLFAISVSDMCGLILQMWHNFCLNPYVEGMDSPLDFLQVQYLTAGWPNVIAVRITGWTTAFMTLERCLSIAVPLKIKQFVTFRKTVGALVLICAVNIASIVPLYVSAYFSWSWDPSSNRTRLGVSFNSNKLEMQGLVFLFHACLTLTSFCSVVTFNAILIVKLRRKSRWRKKVTSHHHDQTGSMSVRERKLIILTVAVASVLVVCYTPAVVCSISTSIAPDFSITGRQANVFHAVWSFAFVLHSINSSINVAVFYRMSSRYRETFRDIVCTKQK